MTVNGLKKILEEHQKWVENKGGKRAELREADLRGINLRGVDLSGANLYGANLCGADLYKANLSRANLYGADLTEVDLCGANLYGTNLYGADLKEAKNIPFVPMACPDTGGFIAWKKASMGYIIKLLIPEDAKRSSATTRKCRASKATVLSIEHMDGTPSIISEVKSYYDPDFIYRVGETVEVENFCEDRFEECAPGIHFFINREDAVNY